MKVFGKQGDSYIVSIPRDELLQIVFGERHVTYSKVRLEAEEFIKNCDRGEVQASVSSVFSKMVEMHNTDLRRSSDGLIAKLDAAKSLITPIEDYIKYSSEQAKPQE